MADAGLTISLAGMDDVEAQMKRIERGLAALQNYEATIFSGLPYAYGIHEGRHRVSGKLARRAGGTRYLSQAANEVMSGADSDLSAGLTKVTAPGVWVVRRLGLWARRRARAIAPRGGAKGGRNYRLWRSIQYKVRQK
jgi:hypothetical protein